MIARALWIFSSSKTRTFTNKSSSDDLSSCHIPAGIGTLSTRQKCAILLDLTEEIQTVTETVAIIKPITTKGSDNSQFHSLFVEQQKTDIAIDGKELTIYLSDVNSMQNSRRIWKRPFQQLAKVKAWNAWKFIRFLCNK